MKKYLLILLALAVALSFGAPLMAKDGLSVDLGFSYNPNGAGMAETILKDGEEGQENGVFGSVIIGENTMKSLKKSKLVSASLNPAISKVEDDGAMSGLNTALRVRYDFLNSFFARVGFTYDKQIMGGSDSFTLGNQTVLGLLAMKQGVAAADNFTWGGYLAGQKVTQEWTYASWSIPLTVGVNIPIADGKYNVYAGLGLTYISGFWQLEVKAPKGYIITDLNGDGAITAAIEGANLDPVKEKVKFEASGIGFNYSLGMNAQVVENVSIFVELDSTIAGGMSDSEKLKTTSGKAGFGSDNVYYPVNLSSTLLRFGASYYIMAL